jgi:DNA-binding NtrC family response regulator
MKTTPHILIADDERSIRLTLETGLSLSGFRVSAARGGREAIEAFRAGDFDAVVCDVFMPDGDGIAVVRELRSLCPATPIVLITAQGSLELAVQAMAEGANDFLAKPFDINALAALLHRHVAARREAESAAGGEAGALFDDFSRSGLVGRSPAMVAVYKLIAHAARSDATALIMGQSGTGKELVARAVHRFSARAGNAFVAVNCSGLTDTLLESELFGHTKGAFTGAGADRAGLFEAAHEGTLFLDELASTSPAFQASLLRVLQSGEVRRVGSTLARCVNVRVIGASNAPLRDLAATGGFRDDLYYRLSVLTIDLPPLRDRAGDVELLAQHFLRRIGGEGQPPFRLTREAAACLAAYPFPGNVRELENALVRASALASNRLITVDCLPAHIARTEPGLRAGLDAAPDILADRPTMDELQRRYLTLVLEESGGNRRQTAKILGLDRRTIQRLLAKYQLEARAESAEDVADDADESFD